MGPIPLAIILVLAGALAVVMGRGATRRRGENFGAAVVAGIVGIPVAVMVISPLLTSDKSGGELLCHVVSRSTPDPQTGNRYTTRPSDCRPSGYKGQTFSLERRVVRASDGNLLRLNPGRIAGVVDSSEATGAHARVTGWAARARDRRPAHSVLIFAGGRFIAAIKPTMSRPDVTKGFRQPLTRSGFRFELPAAVGQEGALRLFGVEDSVASPLRLDCSRKPSPFGCPGS